MTNWLKIQWRTFCVFVPFLRFLIRMPLCLVFIRHGKSLSNEKFATRMYLETEEDRLSIGSFADHQMPLSPEGRQQALHTGPHLRMKFGTPDAVIHSGYLRTRQTMQEILSAYAGISIPVYEDRRWRERESGHTYQMLQSEVDQYYGYMQRYWKLVGPYYARPPSGESLADVLEKRLLHAFADLFQRFAGKRVFLVTHGRVIQCVRAHLDGLNVEQIEAFLNNHEEDPKNCSLMVYRYSPVLNKLVLVEYNTTSSF